MCADLDFYVVFNMARKQSQANLGIKLKEITEKHLCIDLNYAGTIYFNEEISTSVLKMSPITMQKPDSVSSKTLKRISKEIFRQMTQKAVTGAHVEDFETQLQRVQQDSQEDYTKNLLTQKRLHRQQEPSTETIHALTESS